MEKPSLKVALIGGPQYDPLYRSLSIFEKETGISVNIGFKGIHPDLNSHLDYVYRNGLGDYDLVSTHSKYVPSQAYFLWPLQQFFSVSELSQFYPSIVEMFRFQGQLLGIPRDFDERILFYRTDWFKQLRLRVPQTWAQLREACYELKKAGYIGFVYTGTESGLWGTFFEILVGNGGQLFDEKQQPAFNSPAGRSSLQYLVDLYQNGYTPRELPDMKYDEVSAYFRSGNSAMVTDWPGYYSLYNNPATSNVIGRYGIEFMPSGAVRRAVSSGSHGFAIPRSAKNMQNAIMLLKFMTSEGVQTIDADHGHIPVRPALLEREIRKASPGSLDEKRWRILLETLNRYVITPPKFPEFPQTEQLLTVNLHQAIIGKLSVAQALSLAEAQITPIVAKYRNV